MQLMVIHMRIIFQFFFCLYKISENSKKKKRKKVHQNLQNDIFKYIQFTNKYDEEKIRHDWSKVKKSLTLEKIDCQSSFQFIFCQSTNQLLN